jgi:hypothetical protein
MVQQYQEELHAVFDDMQNNELEDAMAFFITRKQHERFHPYSRPRSPRTPSNTTSCDPSSIIQIGSHRAATPNSLSSY